MKKFTLALTLMAFSFGAFAQQLFVEAYSGYNLTMYQGVDQLEDATGYVPIGFKLAGGHEHFQLGIDYRQHITNPELEYTIPDLGTLGSTSFEETFYGAFLRGNVSSLPAYRFGLIAAVGAGYYKPKQNLYLGEPSDDPSATLDYDRKLGYNFYIGISAPIYAQLHWEIGYQLNMVDHYIDGEKFQTGNYQHIHVGLSGNFVFGNTEKKCRRVISSKR